MTDAATADLTRLIQNFERAQAVAPKIAQQYLTEAATDIRARMRALAPVKTGYLMNSIRIISEPGRMTIGPIGVFYAPYMEFGTGTRGEFPGPMYEIRPKTKKNLVFKINGRWVSTKVVKHPGVRARPYARPAARAVLGELGPGLAIRGANAIGGRA